MSRALRAQRRSVIAAKHLFCNGSPDFNELPIPPTRNPMVQMKEITSSSNLAAAGYSPADQVFAVRFSNGKVYHYTNVSTETNEGFEKAESKGSFFAREIKAKHHAVPVVETEQAV